jgi:hypothetical protein
MVLRRDGWIGDLGNTAGNAGPAARSGRAHVRALTDARYRAIPSYCILAVLVGCAPADATSLTFLVSEFVVLSPTPEGTRWTQAGFDLDGVDSTGASTGCANAEADYLAATDEGTAGIDNAFASMVVPPGMTGSDAEMRRALWGTLLTGNIAAGDYLLVIHIEGVNSLEFDAEVDVTVGMGRLASCTAAGDRCEPEVDDGVRVLPGQELVLLGVPARTGGSIRGGRLHVELTDLPGPFLGTNVPLAPLQSTRVIIEAVVDSRRPLTGTMGATFRVDDFVSAHTPALGPPATLQNMLTEHADFSPSDADPESCDEMSFGLRFATVSALLTR